MKKLVFICSKLTQPRIIKRISTIVKYGIDCKVYGFDDGLYETNSKSITYEIEESLVNNETGYLKRRNFRRNQIKRIFELNKDCIFYAFGYDCVRDLYNAGCRKYIYEEADVNAAKKKYSLLRRIAIAEDKKLVKKSLFTVFTSQGFVDYLFSKSNLPNYVLLPNKLSPYFENHNRDSVKIRKLDKDHIVFGFIGLVRYPRTIITFARVIAEHFPQHEFHFFGDVSPFCIDDVNKLCNYPNIYQHGAFSNPTDLQSIYEQIDINIACYDADSPTTKINVKIAEPNKLYESIYFKTPLIVSAETFIGKKVRTLGIGEAINSSDEDSVSRFVESITKEKYWQYINNENNINKLDLLDNPQELIDALMQHLNP